MNKIYSLKYCHITHTIKVVSELAHRVYKGSGKGRKRLPALFLALVPMISGASVVRGDIPYQTYRDFSENKGLFQVGATGVAIFDKNGNVMGHLEKVPMIDFSSVSVGLNSGVATLVNPQYVVSVKHNGGYQTVSFANGQNFYHLVDRNNQPSRDFHVPRLNKLVTEVAPSEMTHSGMINGAYMAKSRYSAFFRIGSGTQQIRDKNGNVVTVTGAYSYLTGGTVGFPTSYDGGKMVTTNTNDQLFNSVLQGPMGTHPRSGDSGSPLFAYDNLLQKWVVVGVDSSGGAAGTNWSVVDTDFVQNMIQEDTNAPVVSRAGEGPLNWIFDTTSGTGTLSQQGTNYQMMGKKGTDLNAGKNLSFSGRDGVIKLQNAVNQGAGSLTFNDNYTVTTDNNSTWIGAGIDIDDGATVIWKINGVKGDNLHKIGAGTLLVNASGVNEGGLKVGDGTTILNQKADRNGKVQAFSSVDIAGGKATVILTDNRQVNPDNITWGYRGGILDINGNDLTFHNLNVTDYGAVLANSSDKMATVFLVTPEILKWTGDITDRESGRVYEFFNNESKNTEYFVLKTKSKGWKLNPEEKDYPDEFRGADYFESADDAVNAARNRGQYIFHGNINGNINFNPDNVGSFIMDGGANITGTLHRENGRLTIHGHPVIHAYNELRVANNVAGTGDHSVLMQPTSFTQDDWENRTFSFGSLVLKNTDFGLGRNAVLNTNILADNSAVTLGDGRVFIDKKEGSGTGFYLEEGISVAVREPDKSIYNGKITLNNNSNLKINDIFNGNIEANNSTINISSDNVVLGDSTLIDSPLNLERGANVLASQNIFSDSPVNITDATLNLNSRLGDLSFRLLPVSDSAASWVLNGNNAVLNVGPFSILSGNITVRDKGSIIIGGEGELTPDLSLQNRMLYSVFNDYRNIWGGTLNAPDAHISITDTKWSMNGNSTVGNMKINRTMIGFSRGSSPFTTLTVDNLDAVHSAFVIHTDLNEADHIMINKSATGYGNSLWVNFLKKPLDGNSLDIPLVSAPEETADNLFKASTQVVGFSNLTPVISIRENSGHKEWVLDGYKVARNDRKSKAAATFMHINYNHFITEVNNINKRMGELRDINGEAGTWARLLNGAGSAEGGGSDRYVLLQMGADRKHELDNMDLFTGTIATYTDTDSSGGLYNGNTKSWGAGVYASGLYPSGAYFDVIAKYIHNENKYDLNFSGAGHHSFRSHSLYAGVEVGYRYHLTDSAFVEPQAELVWGRLQGQIFNWSDSGMDVSMRRDNANPLVGRTGIVSGKTFSDKDWSLTTRAGLHYEFDMMDSGDIHLKDAIGEHQINGRKDGRMLYGVGLSALLGENVRLGLEAERSVFGKYNTDHMINANIRYSF